MGIQISRDHRGAGVAGALLDAAVRYAGEQGADTVEGYPVDTAAGPRPAAAELHTGTVGLFARAGFTVHKRPASGRRVVMRREALTTVSASSISGWPRRGR